AEGKNAIANDNSEPAVPSVAASSEASQANTTPRIGAESTTDV
ncbi:MAG: hypothetical protein ACI8PG_004510, partial [Planctomycetota bacterium]